eukprot:TRINITY_DN8065_c0_g3_i1.p1 TRINITY_DN8065_c0_g3~~TRINITY_DN8065_c0_g3_i1.p1  ORF type:complete len:472 (+),score=228.65 TRINITY_DN8065_c0_g3_i1:46-1461(+)
MAGLPGLQLLCDALGGKSSFEILMAAAASPEAQPESPEAQSAESPQSAEPQSTPQSGTQSTYSSGPSVLHPTRPKSKKPPSTRRPLGYMPDMSKPDIPLEREKVQYDPEGDIHGQFDEVVRKRKMEKKRKEEEGMQRRQEMYAKMEAERAQQSQKELQEVADNIRMRDEREMKLALLRQERDEARVKRMAKLKVSNLNKNVPLHVAMEERYQQEIVLPAMEKQRELLRKMKEKFESPLKDIAEHESAYLAKHREREELHRQEIRRQLKEHNRHLQNWKNKKFEAFLEDERKKKVEKETDLAHKKEMQEKRAQYAKKVQGPLPPLKPKPPQEPQVEIDERRMREMGNEFMRVNKRHARKGQVEERKEEANEDSEKFFAIKNQGNEYMRAAKMLIARDANGAVKKKEPRPPEMSNKELQPLRNKVRRLDRVFDEPMLAESASNDPKTLLKQQQQALDAVAAMQAKLDLLQQLS